MLTTKIVVALRPFQVLLTCAAIIFAAVDQQYRDRDSRLIIILAGGVPATLLTVSAAVQTIWSFIACHEYTSKARTIRWVLDFVIFLILGVLLSTLLVIEDEYRNNLRPNIPWAVMWLGVNCAAVGLFFITWILLAVEDIFSRRTKPMLWGPSVEDSDAYIVSIPRGDLSGEVASFKSKWGTISRPTIIRDPESHLEASCRSTVLLEEPQSRWSEYSGR